MFEVKITQPFQDDQHIYHVFLIKTGKVVWAKEFEMFCGMATLNDDRLVVKDYNGDNYEVVFESSIDDLKLRDSGGGDQRKARVYATTLAILVKHEVSDRSTLLAALANAEAELNMDTVIDVTSMMSLSRYCIVYQDAEKGAMLIERYVDGPGSFNTQFIDGEDNDYTKDILKRILNLLSHHYSYEGMLDILRGDVPDSEIYELLLAA